MGTVNAQVVDVVGRDGLQKFGRTGATDVKHAHVADIEQTGRLAYSSVFITDRRVPDRHIPAAEWHHFCTQRDVRVVQRRFAQAVRVVGFKDK